MIAQPQPHQTVLTSSDDDKNSNSGEHDVTPAELRAAAKREAKAQRKKDKEQRKRHKQIAKKLRVSYNTLSNRLYSSSYVDDDDDNSNKRSQIIASYSRMRLGRVRRGFDIYTVDPWIDECAPCSL
jgi:hypothetical protein